MEICKKKPLLFIQTDTPIEIWKPIKGYEDLYEISNLGRVKSLKYHGGNTSKILKPNKNTKGYLQLRLWRDKNKQIVRVHRLVADAFIPNYNNFPQVNHKDEDKTNNTILNLEWCDNKYNSRYGTVSYRKSINGKNKGKVHPIMMIKDKTVVGIYPSISECVRQNPHLNISCITAVLAGKRKQHRGYQFKSFDAKEEYKNL